LTLKDKINLASFVARPKDSSVPGQHLVLLKITDKLSGVQYEARYFSVQIVDFAFDHVSRPLLMNGLSVVIGVSAVVTYILTLMGQIDTVFGLTSGTAGLAITAYLLSSMRNLFARTQTNTNVAPSQTP
jgi:hypothetical protein